MVLNLVFVLKGKLVKCDLKFNSNWKNNWNKNMVVVL